MKKEMSPKERMKAFSKNEEIDCIPCIPDMGVTMTSALGIKASDYYHSPELMSEVEVKLFKELEHDGVSISTSLRGIAEAMGAKVGYPDYGISYLIEPAISSVDEIKTLNIINPLKDGKIPILLKAIELTKKKLENQVDVGAAMTGPFSVAASIVGTENLLRWVRKFPSQVHELMEVITESNNEYIKEVAKRGVSIGFADPVSSTSLISPKIFEEFSMPYLKKNSNQILKSTGSKPGIHICGKSKAIWKFLPKIGFSSFSIDNVEDLEDVKHFLGDKMTIIGNVPPVDIIHFGSIEDIFTSVKSCIEKGKDSKRGYILSTGCQIPMNTELKNVKAFMDAGRKYGKI